MGFGGWWVGLVPGLGGCGCAGWLAGGFVWLFAPRTERRLYCGLVTTTTTTNMQTEELKKQGSEKKSQRLQNQHGCTQILISVMISLEW